MSDAKFKNNVKKSIFYWIGIIVSVAFIITIYLFSSQNGMESNKISEAVGEKIFKGVINDYNSIYIKLVKEGNTVTSYCSNNEKKWRLIGEPITMPLNDKYYAGLVVFSYSTDILSEAYFDNIQITSQDKEVAGKWMEKDIGYIKKKGSSNISDTSISVKSSGTDSDIGFHYLYKELSGDCTMSARVIFKGNKEPQIKAGIMMRESLDIRGKFTDLALTSADMFVFHWRDTDKMNTVLKTKQSMGLDLNYIFRKIGHFSIFFVFSILLFITLSIVKLPKKRSRYITTLILCFIFASFDEFHQIFVKGRTGRFTDVLIDTAGATLGLIIVFLVLKVRKKLVGG